jgi:hypothetical protein
MNHNVLDNILAPVECEAAQPFCTSGAMSPWSGTQLPRHPQTSCWRKIIVQMFNLKTRQLSTALTRQYAYKPVPPDYCDRPLPQRGSLCITKDMRIKHSVFLDLHVLSLGYHPVWRPTALSSAQARRLPFPLRVALHSWAEPRGAIIP